MPFVRDAFSGEKLQPNTDYRVRIELPVSVPVQAGPTLGRMLAPQLPELEITSTPTVLNGGRVIEFAARTKGGITKTVDDIISLIWRAIIALLAALGLLVSGLVGGPATISFIGAGGAGSLGRTVANLTSLAEKGTGAADKLAEDNTLMMALVLGALVFILSR